MKITNHIKTIFLLLTFLLGATTTHAKTELVLPQKQVVFSVEQTPKTSTLEKEVQPNVGFLSRKFSGKKTKFVAVDGVSAVNAFAFAERDGGKLANAGGDLISIRTNWFNSLKSQYNFNAPFLPQGITPSSVSTTLKSDIINNLPQTLPSNIKENIYITLIKSSSTIPVKKVLNQGDELYKIVTKGNGYSQSSFYMTKTEFNALKNNIDIEQKLGLPLSSHAIEYDVYKATANQTVEVFESIVAPTIQGAYSTTGGAKQTFLLDDSKWTITLETTTLIPPK